MGPSDGHTAKMYAVTSFVSYLLPVGIVAGAMAYSMWKGKHDPATRLAMDRQDPRKHWALVAMALYQGDSGDPGYWGRNRAQSSIQDGWSTPDRDELVKLIERYISGECNVGFDKARIIWLARLGFGAGWFDEETSWRYAFDAKDAIQRTYASWLEFNQAINDGIVEWYGGDPPKARMDGRGPALQFAARTYFDKVAFR